MAFNSVITDSTPWGTYSAPMNENATEVYSVLYHTYNWTLEAVCGALGSMSIESFVNPGQYELGHGTPTSPWGYGYGVGLIQFTSPDPTQYPNPWLYWCQQHNKAITDGYEQLYLIANAEDPAIQSMGLSTGIWGWLSGPAPLFPVSLAQYAASTDPPARMAEIFYQNMEYHGGSGDTSLPNRIAAANHWYEYFTGVVPPDPGPGPGTLPGTSKFWMYIKPQRRKK